MKAADLEKDCYYSFMVCVAISMFVLGLWEITLRSCYFWNKSIDLAVDSSSYSMHDPSSSPVRSIRKTEMSFSESKMLC